MKQILLLIALIPCCAFTQKKQIKDTTSKQPILNTKASIKNFMINYYRQKFEKEKAEYPGSRVKVYKDGNTTIVKHQLDKNDNWGPMRQIPNTAEFIEGYLNNDTIKDVVVSVYSIGTAGGKVSWSEMFVFMSNNNKLEFHKLYTSYDLGACTLPDSYSGKFYPSKIINHTLIGGTECHTATDPGCCPSLSFTTTFKFDDGLKLVSQTKN